MDFHREEPVGLQCPRVRGSGKQPAEGSLGALHRKKYLPYSPLYDIRFQSRLQRIFGRYPIERFTPVFRHI